jgi:hypothetical protein
LQSSFDKANSANVLAQAAFDRANTPGSGQFAFEKANSANVLAQSAFNQANTAVALLCNHQKNVSTDIEKTIQKN